MKSTNATLMPSRQTNRNRYFRVASMPTALSPFYRIEHLANSRAAHDNIGFRLRRQLGEVGNLGRNSGNEHDPGA